MEYELDNMLCNAWMAWCQVKMLLSMC